MAHSGDWVSEPVWNSYEVATWNSTPYLAERREVPATILDVRDQIIHEFDLLKPKFALSRGDEAQDAFFYSDVKSFLIQYGEFALRLLDMYISNNSSVSPATRYHFACLLGHVDDAATDGLRREFLADYLIAHDEALRTGAQDALDFLDLV